MTKGKCCHMLIISGFVMSGRGAWRKRQGRLAGPSRPPRRQSCGPASRSWAAARAATTARSAASCRRASVSACGLGWAASLICSCRSAASRVKPSQSRAIRAYAVLTSISGSDAHAATSVPTSLATRESGAPAAANRLRAAGASSKGAASFSPLIPDTSLTLSAMAMTHECARWFDPGVVLEPPRPASVPTATWALSARPTGRRPAGAHLPMPGCLPAHRT